MILIKIFKKISRIPSFIRIKLMNIIYSFQYKKIGNDCIIHRQLIINNKNKISLGKKVILFPNSRIELITEYANEFFHPKLKVDDHSQIHQNCHITCADEIKIGKNVVIVSNVTITDIVHPYQNINIPINKAKIKTSPVSIGDQTYIYNNCVILPGTKIGKHCIIGANSIVSGIIPNYSVVVGSPARVIKSYNSKTHMWEKV